MTCFVQGCPTAVHAKGMCNRHYLQVYRAGEVSRLPDGRLRGTELVGGSQSPTALREQLQAAAKAQEKAQACYDLVRNFAGRMRWRAELNRASKDLATARAALSTTPEGRETLRQFDAGELIEPELAAVIAAEADMDVAEEVD